MLTASPRLLVVLALLAAGCAGEAPETEAAVASGAVEVQSNETDDVVGPDFQAPADTTGPARVTVSGETVPARATVVDMQSNDRACSLTLREGSTEETVFADYSVCETNVLIGRRVQIEYAPSTIPAASCEGDPDCLDTESVALAVVATPIDG